MTDKIVSHYRILEPIGEGGMGVVYRAEDIRLKRTVALKFLSKEMTGSGDQADRFLREAQAAAALDHPNICTMYEIDEEAGQTFLAMAFLEGETLEKRIERGPLPIELVLEIGKQAADGLAAAHRAGVVHRDVKSANIMLAEDNGSRPIVKLMDFGLAQVSGASKLTNTETRLGTITYMSPEQASGAEVGSRSDLWSLGVVLYEAVTGELPFQGHYDQAIVYSILHEEPQPLTALRARVPMELEWIVEKCLAKRPSERYQDARELVSDLGMLQRRVASGKTAIRPIRQSAEVVRERLGEVPRAVLQDRSGESESTGTLRAESSPVRPRPHSPKATGSRWSKPLVRRVSLVTIAAAAFVAGILSVRSVPEDTRARRFTLRPIEAIRGDQSIGHLAISPDGRNIAFSTTGSNGTLWMQPLDRHDPVPIEGTRGARDVFWSPDSSFLGFVTSRALGKVALRTWVVTMLVEDTGAPVLHASWSADGESIVFVPIGGSPMQLSAYGGTPQPLLESVPQHRAMITHPSLLETPDGEQVLLYSERSLDGDSVMLLLLSGGQPGNPVRLVAGSSPVYSPTGHLLFRPSAMTSALWAIRFSLRDLQTQGDGFLVAQNASEPSVSTDGTLVYLDDPHARQQRLLWVDRAGNLIGEIGKPQPWIAGPRVSPSGDQVLASGGRGRNFDLWVHDAERPVVNRLSFDDVEETGAAWASDETRVAFTQRGSPDLKVLAVGGGAPAETIYSSPDGPIGLLDWSRNGRYILIRKRRPRGSWPGISFGAGVVHSPSARTADGIATFGQSGIEYLVRREDGARWEAREFLPEVPFIVDDAVFSPDGSYVAYESNESGEMEVYVKPFPSGEQRWQLTTDGGRLARWSDDGKELYYIQGETLYAVQVQTEDGFRAYETTALFTRASLGGMRRFPTYDTGRAGRFAVVGPAGGPQQPTIRVVLNWFSEFKGL